MIDASSAKIAADMTPLFRWFDRADTFNVWSASLEYMRKTVEDYIDGREYFEGYCWACNRVHRMLVRSGAMFGERVIALRRAGLVGWDHTVPQERDGHEAERRCETQAGSIRACSCLFDFGHERSPALPIMAGKERSCPVSASAA